MTSRHFSCTLIFLVMLTGCVSLNEYEASLADNIAMKQNLLSREELLRRKDSEIKELNARIDDLIRDNDDLGGILKSKKDELNRRIAELRSKLLDKERELAVHRKRIETLTQEQERAVSELQATYDSLVGEMREEIEKGEVKITQLQDRLSVTLVEKVLFDSGSAEIKRGGKRVLERVSAILRNVTGKRIEIEGHTDNVPIGPGLSRRFATNWELSTARATTVTRYLEEKGVSPQFLSACGYSEHRPVAPNDSEEGRAQNRRIEIALVPLVRTTDTATAGK